MSELGDKVKKSIERLRAFEPENGYHLAFSGGKDSCVIKALAEMSGVHYKGVYRVTSVDPPELVQFIKREHPDIEREIPRYKDGSPITMWNLIPKKQYPPTRLVRYCCESLKESSTTPGAITVTGVRWAESQNRKSNQGLVTFYRPKKGLRDMVDDSEILQNTSRGGLILNNDNDDARKLVEQCYQKNRTVLNPIIDWTDKEVWGFLRGENIPVCELYNEGFHRLGCVGCPMGGRKSMLFEFNRWPKYKAMYIRAFDKMLKEFSILNGETKRQWGGRDATGQAVFDWWTQDPNVPGQMSMFEDE